MVGKMPQQVVINKKKQEANRGRATLPDNDKLIYYLFGLSVLFVIIARIHLLDFPFERDEGEFAYMGKLILDGHPPYSLAYNMKLPGTYYLYALIMKIFGRSVTGVHMGLTLVIVASMFLLFLISKTFISKTGALISAATFGIMGTSWTLLAQAAHATHFVSFFALCGIYVLLQLYKNEQNKTFKYLTAGGLLSMAFICKQSGIFFLFLGITLILLKECNKKPFIKLAGNIAILVAGFIIPVLTMMFYLYFFSDFGNFWFWTVTYLSKYGNQVPVSDALPMFKMAVGTITENYTSTGYVALWIVSLLGLLLVPISKSWIQHRILFFSFFFFSFLTILPGFYFRPHYFITLLPAVALSVAVFFEVITRYIADKTKMSCFTIIGFFLFLVLIGTGIKANANYLFKQNPEISCKQIYGSNPFAESVKIAEFLKNHTNAEDKIAVLGSEPQICFYADRYAATGYLYTYGLMESHDYALSMQQEMIKEIEQNKPAFLIYVNIGTSWLKGPHSNLFIFNWTNEYIHKNYRLAGICEIFPYSISSLKVYEQLNNFKPHSQELIYLFEKK
ncbi:MAG: glycosyltransferase family 39 protein [Bacteroidales bacterium]|nr:glycosyltransferase family 39 protein [Bacteroidales bacterium]